MTNKDPTQYDNTFLQKTDPFVVSLEKDVKTDRKVSQQNKKKSSLLKSRFISFSSTAINSTSSNKNRKSIVRRQKTTDCECDVNNAAASSTNNSSTLKTQKKMALESFQRWREQAKRCKDDDALCYFTDSFEFPDTYQSFEVQLYLQRRHVRRLAVDYSGEDIASSVLYFKQLKFLCNQSFI